MRIKLYNIILDFISVDHSIRCSYHSELKEIVKEIDRIVLEKDIDVLHVSGFPLNRILSYYSNVPKVLDLSDSRALLKKREYENSKQIRERVTVYMQYTRAKRIEDFIVNNYSMTTVVSDVDSRSILENIPTARIAVITNGVDTNFFRPIQGVKEEYPSLIFFGNMNFPPNIDAALYLHSEVLPLVKKAIPKVKLYIVGRNPVSEIQGINGKNDTILTGEVEDVRPYIMRSSLVVIPMRIGSGIKNKVLETMAMGKPLVSTPRGVEALRPEVRANIPIGIDAGEIAERIVSLLNNEGARKALAQRVPRIVRKYHSWKLCADEYEKIYEKLIDRGKC